ncbi:MAG TPA: CPBP family intramembrane glutamic endopeptidase [Parvularculaceae bacterium]|nr:CPBP family intramembrane glutamic endopeptidase [Parvularculaceae bacterium]
MSAYSVLDFFLAAFAVFFVPVQAALAGRNYARTPRSELNLAGRYRFAILRNLALIILIVLDWHWTKRSLSALGLDIPIGFWGRAGFVFDVVLACYYVYGLLLRKFTSERLAILRKRLEGYRILPQTREEFFYFPILGVTGGIFEELLYRGFLIWFLTPFAGLYGAVVISSVIFGFGHAYQGWRGVLRTALIGLAFGIGYALTHSLWWLMAAHVLIGLFADLIALRLKRLASA